MTRVIRSTFRLVDRIVRAILRLPEVEAAPYVPPWRATVRDDLALRRPVLLLARLLRWRVKLRTTRWLPWFQLRTGTTVVIVNWQSVRLLPTVVAAVRRYSPADVDIIVVDNGSDDGSRAVVEDLARRGEVRAVLLPKNLYHGPAMDLGFLLARTQVVVALDVDAFPIEAGWIDRLIAPLVDVRSGIHVTGATGKRGYIHPCCLAMRLDRFAEQRHTFAPHLMGDTSLALLDDDWGNTDTTTLRWDTGESISRREGMAACEGLPRTSWRGPAELGSIFGGIVFHNGGSTRIPEGEVVAGISIQDVWSSWDEAVATHVAPEGVRAMTEAEHLAELAVVIPAHNAAGTIGQQLDALLEQDLAAHRCEVIVADNCSSDDTAAIVARYAASHARIHLVHALDRRGAGYARDVGVRATCAPRIAFCDADDVVGDGWLDAMGSALATHRFVTGPTELELLNPPWIAGSRGTAHATAMTTFEGAFPFASSCNVGIHRADFEAVGGFDDTYAPGEDIELSFRLWRAGVELHFEPDALVHYRYRATLAESFRRARRYGAVRPQIGEELREIGATPPDRLAGVRNWLWLVRHLPLLASKRGQARWLWVAGQRIGNIEGGLRVGRFYL